MAKRTHIPQVFARRRSLVAASVVAAVAWSLACSGAASEHADGNVEACHRYVDHMNSLDCMDLTYDRDEMCQGAELSPADMVPYYDCARENARCEEGQKVIDIAACRQPVM